jgi:sec-independent protein translocase protein TatA
MVGDILQPTHLLFVLVVALLVLGPKRLPEVGRTLGTGLRDFRAAINGESHEKHDEIDEKPWHSEPDLADKHEFAHDGETTPETHEFAHQAPEVPAGESAAAKAEPVSAEPEATPAQPAAAETIAAAPDKHQFAYESSESAENPADPRT